MPRLCIGLSLPESVRTHCAGLWSNITDVHWLDPETYHITLCLIGEVEGPKMIDLIDELTRLHHQAINLHVSGIEIVSKKNNMSGMLAALISPTPALLALQGKVKAALFRAGLSAKRGAFKPHITLAQFRQAPPNRLGIWLEQYALFRTSPFRIDDVNLYSRHLSLKRVYYKKMWTCRLE